MFNLIYFLLPVQAIDGDRGINNRISYSIIAGGEEHFDIDSSSGVVYTVNQLDREDPNNSNGAYILEILVIYLTVHSLMKFLTCVNVDYKLVVEKIVLAYYSKYLCQS